MFLCFIYIIRYIEENNGKDYIYDHETKFGFSGQNYFPPTMERIEFYSPQERGFEREMKKRLEFFCTLRLKLNSIKK